MEKPKKTRNDQEKKKMLINLGGGAGGGIGTVVLLATAAVASVFIVRRSKDRNSGENRHRRCRTPPPQLNTLQTDQKDEARKGQQLFIIDTSSEIRKDQSFGSAKLVGLENDANQNIKTEKFPVDENSNIKINSGNPNGVVYDGETGGENLWSIRDGSVTNIDGELQSMDEQSRFEPKNMMPEPKIEFTTTEIANGKHDFNEICIEGGRSQGEATNSEDRIEETKDEGNGDVYSDKKKSEETETETEEKNMDKELGEIHSMVNGEIIDDECDETDEKTTKEKDEASGVEKLSEEEIVESDDEMKQDEHSTEIVSTIHEDKSTVIPLVQEWNQPETEIVIREECKEEQWPDENSPNSGETDLKMQAHEEKISVDDDEEKSCTDNPTNGNIQLGDYEMNEVDVAMPLHEEEVNVYDGDSEKEQDTCEDDAEENMGMELEEDSSEPFVATSVDHIGNMTEKQKGGHNGTIPDLKDYYSGDDEEDEEETDDLSDEESSVETGESSLDVEIWLDKSIQETPSHEIVKQIIDHEVEGKIQEDIKLKQPEKMMCFKGDECDYRKRSESFSKMDEGGLIDGKGKDGLKNFGNPEMVDVNRRYLIRRTMMIGFLSVLSSLSCSWFFGLSFVKLCLLMLCTMALSQVHSY